MLINRTEKQEIQHYRNNSRSIDTGNTAGKQEALTRNSDKRKYSGTVNLEIAQRVAEIASKYQVRNATAKEIADMSSELYNEGAISLEEHQVLSYNREFHFDYYDFSDKYPDLDMGETPKRDFVQFWKESHSAELENNNPKKAETAGRIVNILENFDLAVTVN